MDYLKLIAAVLALFATIGHFTMGNKLYLAPVLSSNIDTIPKNIMLGLFHYASVFMVLSTIVLLGSAFKLELWQIDFNKAEILIAIIYGGWALVQIIIVFTSSVKKGFAKMFQWLFWFTIAVLVFVSNI